MSELDVDLAIHALEQGVDDLLVASRNPDMRPYVEAHRQRLNQEIGRLREALAELHTTATRVGRSPPSDGQRMMGRRSGGPDKKRAAGIR